MTAPNRRIFLKTCATASVASILPRGARAGARSPNATLQHACIGVGGMGGADITNIRTHERTRIVALCDVDRARLEKVAAQFPDARTYVDWRELLAAEGDRIDSVNVAVPDHMHAIIATNAMRAGKHVYCQKPLCHDMAECRLLRDTALRKGVVTQLGIQHSAGIGDRMATQMLARGAVGTVEHVTLFSNRKGVSRIQVTRPDKADPIPPTLAWDLWIGTAPERPYAEGIYHPLIWRIWQDFGSAWIGDIGCHLHSPVWTGIGLTTPISVIAQVQDSWRHTPARFRETWPQGAHITWIYPGNEFTGGKPLTVEWFDGMTGVAEPNLLPPPQLQEIARRTGLQQLPMEGSIVTGSEGWLLLPHTNAPSIIPKNPAAPRQPAPKLEPRTSHYHDFLDACIDGRKASADFSRVAPMVEAVLLGNVAERAPDTLLEWDAPGMRIPNAPAANRFLRRTYRAGWELAGLA